MSLENELERISGAKADLKEAIEEKGVEVGDTEAIEAYADHVRSIKAEESVQADWNENDPTAKGYVQNRPMYQAKVNTPVVEWDGDTTGKTVVEFELDGKMTRLVKVSDDVWSNYLEREVGAPYSAFKTKGGMRWIWPVMDAYDGKISGEIKTFDGSAFHGYGYGNSPMVFAQTDAKNDYWVLAAVSAFADGATISVPKNGKRFKGYSYVDPGNDGDVEVTLPTRGIYCRVIDVELESWDDEKGEAIVIERPAYPARIEWYTGNYAELPSIFLPADVRRTVDAVGNGAFDLANGYCTGTFVTYDEQRGVELSPYGGGYIVVYDNAQQKWTKIDADGTITAAQMTLRGSECIRLDTPKTLIKDESGEKYFQLKTSSDGTLTLVDNTNGEEHPIGAKGDTPVKGVDYYTDADKAELVEAVIAALPEAEGVSY